MLVHPSKSHELCLFLKQQHSDIRKKNLMDEFTKQHQVKSFMKKWQHQHNTARITLLWKKNTFLPRIFRHRRKSSIQQVSSLHCCRMLILSFQCAIYFLRIWTTKEFEKGDQYIVILLQRLWIKSKTFSAELLLVVWSWYDIALCYGILSLILAWINYFYLLIIGWIVFL